MTVQKIYEIYTENLKNENPMKKPVSFETLKRIFYSHFNLRCKSLKKDTCNRCDALTHKIKNSESEDVKLKLTKEKEEHLKLAETLRKQMNADLMRAKTDNLFECLTFDLEKTLPLPEYQQMLCSINASYGYIIAEFTWAPATLATVTFG